MTTDTEVTRGTRTEGSRSRISQAATEGLRLVSWASNGFYWRRGGARDDLLPPSPVPGTSGLEATPLASLATSSSHLHSLLLDNEPSAALGRLGAQRPLCDYHKNQESKWRQLCPSLGEGSENGAVFIACKLRLQRRQRVLLRPLIYSLG